MEKSCVCARRAKPLLKYRFVYGVLCAATHGRRPSVISVYSPTICRKHSRLILYSRYYYTSCNHLLCCNEVQFRLYKISELAKPAFNILFTSSSCFWLVAKRSGFYRVCQYHVGNTSIKQHVIGKMHRKSGVNL